MLFWSTLFWRMMVGNTNFSSDCYSGLFKKAFSRSSVSTLTEISAFAKRATTSGRLLQLIRDVAGKKLVMFCQLSAYLSQFSSPSPTSLPTTTLGGRMMEVRVTLKHYSDSNKETTKHSIPVSGQPEETDIPDLDISRHWHLYDNIRKYLSTLLLLTSSGTPFISTKNSTGISPWISICWWCM